MNANTSTQVHCIVQLNDQHPINILSVLDNTLVIKCRLDCGVKAYALKYHKWSIIYSNLLTWP